VLNNVGLTLAIDKQYDKAIVALQKGVALAPQEGDEKKRLALNLALVYGITGNMAAAEETAKPYLTPAGLDNNMGYYAHLAKDDELAKTYLNMALTKSPVYYQRAWDNLDTVSKDPKAANRKERNLQTIVKGAPASSRIDEKVFE
jgi:Flp pilus assembly protein TadD